jgi:DNA-binding LacI/PurR family transcriptional regulator
MNATIAPSGGRSVQKLVRHIRDEIGAGGLPGGDFLPTERALAERFGIARMTARRALKVLEAEGLLAAVPRHGYKVALRAANDPSRGCPLAYVLDEPNCLTPRDEVFHKVLFHVFQQMAGRRGSALLAAYGGANLAAKTMEQLKAARVWGAAVDSVNPDLLRLMRVNGLPAVMVDAWREDAEIDAVVQDDFQGGLLAAAHLLQRNCRRIAWVGAAVGNSAHSVSRYGGVAAALARAGLGIPPELRCEGTSAELEPKVRALLKRRDRPVGIAALWSETGQLVARVADELRLFPGRDYELVSWATEEQYDSAFASGFPRARVPPAIVWNMEAMADLAVTRLAERKANPRMRVARINVPVRLRLPDGRTR